MLSRRKAGWGWFDRSMDKKALSFKGNVVETEEHDCF